MNRLVVTATKEEYDLVKPYFDKVIITGIGYGNVFEALKNINRDQPILNVGYAGSNKLPIGVMCKVSESRAYHPNVSFAEKFYILENNGFICYSSSDFVISTKIKEPILFDMELFAIMSMGFTNVKALKIVSDNLNVKEYERR